MHTPISPPLSLYPTCMCPSAMGRQQTNQQTAALWCSVYPKRSLGGGIFGSHAQPGAKDVACMADWQLKPDRDSPTDPLADTSLLPNETWWRLCNLIFWVGGEKCCVLVRTGHCRRHHMLYACACCLPAVWPQGSRRLWSMTLVLGAVAWHIRSVCVCVCGGWMGSP